MYTQTTPNLEFMTSLCEEHKIVKGASIARWIT